MAEQRFMSIAAELRDQVLAGTLVPGDKLPTIKELAASYRCAGATAQRALGQLVVEGVVRTSPRGSFVADEAPVSLSPAERAVLARRTGSILAEGETAVVTAAELVVPPLYVSEIFDLDHGDQVVRREYVVGRSRTRSMLAVDWFPAHFAAQVPDLLSTAPGKVRGLLSKVLETVGRTPTSARDDMHAREADQREAHHLGIPPGAPTLAGAHRWSDADGMILYGEWCLPPRMTLSYETAPAPAQE
ncbi:GntR family transcriptional regulator [Streptomyces sp. NBC_01795]|uniref:GntR family transcriptional regulator n=1 Tax=unclassified Streptomyces TaxID=2593676 RepID=UPI002DDC5BBB|nr:MULTISPECIES: GntR family transcriptional regulator [unclassified Streptomyces]WSA92833.1 GntR family transcriptional regulator [Streptomyces sp. NBC_01795]WSB77203.1 GntR family transcriptional regulator [Streptomyces sp. NBC_01775]WSS14533.1 GntR family transcriptional regulator [Streptomyces sp. NBC_01186]